LQLIDLKKNLAPGSSRQCCNPAG